MSAPTVTVVIPCFNHGRFIEDAVRSCLAQTGADVRVIVVDDGSDDGATPGACDACAENADGRVAVVHQPNMGLPATRNRGAREARERGGEWAGEYLVFLDADDWIEPTFVEKLHAAVTAGSDELRGPVGENSAVNNGTGAGRGGWSPAGGVSHAYCQERLVERATMVWQVPEWDAELMMVTNLHPVTTLMRRECFEAVGGFDETMKEGYEDWDLWLKFVERGWRGVRVREPLFIWRRHSENTMIVEAGLRHERLYRRLVDNHPEMFARHAPALLVIANAMLRRADANWLDETHEAIVVRDLRRWAGDLVRERDGVIAELNRQRELGALREQELGAQLSRLVVQHEEERRGLVASMSALLESERNARRAEAQVAAAQLALARSDAERTIEELRRVTSEYEAKPAVRVSRAVHRVIDSMPEPVRVVVKAPLRAASAAMRKKAPPSGAEEPA